MRKLLLVTLCTVLFCPSVLGQSTQSKSVLERFMDGLGIDEYEYQRWTAADDESKCLSEWPTISRGQQFTKQMLDACRQAAKNLRSSVNWFEKSQLDSTAAYLKLKQENESLRSKVEQLEQVRATSELALDKMIQELQVQTTLRSSSSQNAVTEALIFYWFDEQVRPKSTVYHIVISARAYDEVIAILQKTLGEKTTKLRPEPYPFRRWLESASPRSVPSIFYWWDETLTDDTPVMDFYMTRRAYEQTVAIVRQEIDLPENLIPQPKRSKWRSFLEGLAYVSAAALQGGAEAYAAEQQRMQGDATTWELRRLNSTLSAMQWQMFNDQLARDYARNVNQWQRTTQRLTNGRWP